jgi:SWI/SNF-related matrix-associated actin-dependent regulator of chromatin subfamily B protein 1
VDDYALAPSYHSVVVKSIQEQLGDFRSHSFNYDQDSGDPVVDLNSETPIQQGALDDAQEKWWMVWRRRVFADGATRLGKNGSLKRSKKKRKLDFNNPSNNAPAAITAGAGAGAGSEVVKVKKEEQGGRDNVAGGGVTFDVSMDEEEFGRPMAIDEIKLDEELMHEEMRILIKVCYAFLPFAASSVEVVFLYFAPVPPSPFFDFGVIM